MDCVSVENGAPEPTRSFVFHSDQIEARKPIDKIIAERKCCLWCEKGEDQGMTIALPETSHSDQWPRARAARQLHRPGWTGSFSVDRAWLIRNLLKNRRSRDAPTMWVNMPTPHFEPSRTTCHDRLSSGRSRNKYTMGRSQTAPRPECWWCGD